MIEARIAFAPYEAHGFRPPPPTAKSWRFLRDNANVTGVRLQYLADDPRWWDGAFQAVVDADVEVHGNFCVNNMRAWATRDIEFTAERWTKFYGAIGMKSVSFGNEPGYAFGDDDISKGGTRDYMRELVENYWRPFIRGVRRANATIPIGGCDAESAETLQRFVDLIDVDQWFVHPYGERELADDGELDYATMAGANGKPGFVDVAASFLLAGERTRVRPLIISEADHQEHKAARARGEQRGIATDEEIIGLAQFSRRMRDEFNALVVTLGTGEYFCTRIPNGLWRGKLLEGNPHESEVLAEASQVYGIADLTRQQLVEQFGDRWSTFTYPKGGDPVMSRVGKLLASEFTKPVSPVSGGQQGRHVGRRKIVKACPARDSLNNACVLDEGHDGRHLRSAPPGHLCHAVNCNVAVPPKMLMCLKHWRMVPKTLQARVWETYRPGQEIDKNPTAEYLEAQEAAVDAVAAKEGKVRHRAGAKP